MLVILVTQEAETGGSKLELSLGNLARPCFEIKKNKIKELGM